jgi:hypothetical protein
VGLDANLGEAGTAGQLREAPAKVGVASSAAEHGFVSIST